MNGSTIASLRSAPPPAEVELRLALTELLLACDDPTECAQRAVDWLGEQLGLGPALCALVASDGERLAGVAGFAVPRARVRDFSLDLEPRDHPLIEALLARRFTAIAPGQVEAPAAPVGVPFVAVPLHGGELRPRPVGLLLLHAVPSRAARTVRWLADLLGRQLGRLLAPRTLVDVERRLDRERNLLQRIIDAVPDPILLTDTEGRMIRANGRARGLFAATDGESEGRRRAVALNNMLFSAALSQRAIGGAARGRRELPLVNPTEGSDLLFELLTTVAHDPRAGTALVSILRNVTDLRRATEEIEASYRKLMRAEAHVRAERDRLDLIIDSVADPILVTDPMENVVLMNTPAERLFTAAAAKSPEAERAVRANDAHFSSFIANLFFAGQEMVRRGELALTDPRSGATIPVEAIAGKILSARGEVTAVATILHDRSEAIEKARLYEQVKRASTELEEKVRAATAELVLRNELLQRQHMQLEQASALKSQFLANVSHEFRTPLNAILGYTSLLLCGASGALSTVQEGNLRRVDSNANHLLALINEILDIARIEAGKMPLQVSQFRLTDLVAEVTAEIEPLVDRSKLEVTTRLSPRLGPIRSDRRKLKQILLNLITNALKFTRAGQVRVTGALEARGESIAIAVADSGVGIAEEDRERIFDEFRQVDGSPGREFGSSGLGLAICRRLAEVLGGRITLVSALGVGSTFTLHLPRRRRGKGTR